MEQISLGPELIIFRGRGRDFFPRMDLLFFLLSHCSNNKRLTLCVCPVYIMFCVCIFRVRFQ